MCATWRSVDKENRYKFNHGPSREDCGGQHRNSVANFRFESNLDGRQSQSAVGVGTPWKGIKGDGGRASKRENTFLRPNSFVNLASKIVLLPNNISHFWHSGKCFWTRRSSRPTGKPASPRTNCSPPSTSPSSIVGNIFAPLNR